MLRVLSGVVLVLLLLPRSGMAQTPAPEDVVFFTADQVELAGTFYPSSRGARAPAVLLLHRIGGSRQDSGLPELAVTLQKKGYSVLSFDFRGHGESTTVSGDFWLVPGNRDLRGASGQSQKLNHEDFSRTAHFAALVNDIAAARYVLDLKSREGACDSSNVILIGADTGATLGALWLAAEWKRPRTTRDAAGKIVKQGLEGHDVACAVWLSMSPTLHGRQTVPVESWLGSPVRERVPMGFLCGGADGRSGEFATALQEKLKQGGGLNGLTGARFIGRTDRVGHELLSQESLEVDKLLLTYIDNVLKERKKIVRARSDAEGPPPLVPLEQFGIR